MLEGKESQDGFINNAFSTFLNNTQDLVFLKNESLVYMGASNAFAQLVGRSDGSELVGKTDFDLFNDQELAKRYREDDKSLMEKGKPLIDYIEPMPGKDGSYAYCSTCKYLVHNAQGKVVGIWGTSRDVTREYQARIHYEREMQHLFELPEAALTAALFDITGWRVVDIRTTIGYASATSYYETIDGFVQHMGEVVQQGDEASVFFHSFTPETLFDIYNSGKRHFSMEYLRRMPEGVELWVRNEFHFLSDPVNGHLSLLITLLDIDAEHRSRDTLARAAERDAMTNLLNRDATMRHIEAFLKDEGVDKIHALFLIDLDNFKLVNDTFGHQMGDAVLVQAAGIIRSNFRETDIVGRIGGDEFFALMKDLDAEEHAQHKAQGLVAALQYVCNTPEATVEISSSVGISLCTEPNVLLSRLYAEADAALYDAKRAGKNTFSVYRAPQLTEQEAVPEACPVINTVNLHTLLNKIDAGVIIFHTAKGESIPSPIFFSDSLLGLMGNLTRKEAMELYCSSDTLASVHPDDAQRVYSEYQDAFATNSALRTSFRKRGKDNVYVWVSVGSTITRHADESFDVYSVYTNIDGVMKTEAELREKNRILEFAMKNTDINIWFWDVHTKICTLTPNCQAVHGMNVNTLENFPDCLFQTNYVREDCVALMREKFAQIVAGAPEVIYDSWYRQNNEVGYWCERVVLTTVFADDGAPMRVIGIGKNVTATKEFEQKYLAVKSGMRPLANSVGSYIVNLTANRCVKSEGCVTASISMPENATADSFFEQLQAQVLQQEDCARANQLFSREAMLNRYARGKTAVSLEYLSSGCGAGYKWVRTTAEMLENPETTEVEAIVHCVDIDEEKRMQLTMERLLITDYELLCQVDAKTGRFILLAEKIDGKMSQYDCRNLYYDNKLQSFLHKFVADEYYEQSAVALNLDTIVRKLAKTPVYTCSFPNKAFYSLSEGHRQWRSSYLDEMQSIVLITRIDITDMFSAETDPITRLYNRQAFYRYVRKRLNENPSQDYAIVRYDLDRFKAYNDAFGTQAGDKLLGDMARTLGDNPLSRDTFWARLDADHFVALTQADVPRIEQWSGEQAGWLAQHSPSFHLTCSVGAYHITDPDIDVSFMCDRALLALKTVKTRYDTTVGWYQDSMRSQLIEEQTLIDETGDALKDNQFVVHYQPQVDYSDGSLVGAEALVRWNHPQRGLLGPDAFVPLFEKNGFISRLDEYVWETVCRYMRDWSARIGEPFPVPISVNISRINLYDQTLCDRLCDLVDRYQIPRTKLRLEITESAYMDSPEQLINVVKRLKQMEFTVEMDDFGAGYSSLNTLKDVPVDVLKLDVRFLSDGDNSSRGGNILSSIIRMAHWLKLPVVAEGVETKSQADYLKSLSCVYMQGYYFSRPIAEPKFSSMLEEMRAGNMNRFADANLDGVAAFWDPSAQNALLFNSFVGGAIIVEYHRGTAEVVRANDSFFSELGTTREQYMHHQLDVLERFSPPYRAKCEAMLQATIQVGGEAECELKSLPLFEGQTASWTYNRARLLAKNDGHSLIYVSVQNITSRKKMEEQLRVQQQELQIAVSQMGALVCRYDVSQRTLTLPQEYAHNRSLPMLQENIPDSLLPRIMQEDRPLFQAMFDSICSGEKKGEVSVRFFTQEGNTVTRHHTFTTVFSSEGKPVRAIISIKDIL